MGKIKDTFTVVKDTTEDVFRNVGSYQVQMIRQRMMKEYWIPEYGIDPNNPDFSNPYFALEWELCDPAIRMRAKSKNPDVQAEIMANWTDKMKQLWFYGDEETNGAYKDSKFWSSAFKTIKGKVKGRKA